MTNLFSSLSNADIKTILQVALSVAKTFKERSAKWKNKSGPGLIVAIVAVFGLLITAVYFIGTHKITPMLIYVACCIPILSLGLAISTRNIDKIEKEFHEYETAMDKVMDLLTDISNSVENEDAEAALGAIIMCTYNLDEEALAKLTYQDIIGLPEFQKAANFAVMAITLKDALQQLKEENADVTELLNQLNALDESDLDMEEDMSDLYESITGTKVDDLSSSSCDSSKDTST